MKNLKNNRHIHCAKSNKGAKTIGPTAYSFLLSKRIDNMIIGNRETVTIPIVLSDLTFPCIFKVKWMQKYKKYKTKIMHVCISVDNKCFLTNAFRKNILPTRLYCSQLF